MKYYAVTNDPAELMHYGIKGMKWGVIRTDAQLGHPTRPKRPRSTAYKKASNKLHKMMKSGIEKAKANWKEYNSPKAKAQRRYEKHVQLARQGRLKYKGISDAEVRKITDRLALERQSRQLSGTEKSPFLRRVRESVGEGLVRGIGAGTAAYFEERGRGRGKTTADIKREKRLAKYHSNKRVLRREAKRIVDEEYYKNAAENGDLYNPIRAISKTRVTVDAYGRPMQIDLHPSLTRSGRARELRRIKEANERDERQKKFKDNYDKTYASVLAKNKVEREFAETNSTDKPRGLPSGSSNSSSGKSSTSEKTKPVTININNYGHRVARSSKRSDYVGAHSPGNASVYRGKHSGRRRKKAPYRH